MNECDLIMKGGITSGVVYPHAIRKIAKAYRLRSIGGTSAGAIAATFAAAAEYRRQENHQSMVGFDQIGALAEELGDTMFSLFQPTPKTEPLFKMLLSAIDQKSGGWRGVLRAIPGAFAEWVLLGGLLLVFSVALGVFTGNWALGVLGVLLSLLLSLGMIGVQIKRMLFVDLPAQDFGLCSGKTRADQDALAFGDWIAQKIDHIAGKEEGPLTVGDLRRNGIEIATVMTDLSSKRPYRLPLETNIHYFSKAEFARLFPDSMVEYLCKTGKWRAPREGDPSGLPKDLYQLPVGDDFPVFLVARLSLSFPGLISGVPLWRLDYLAKEEVFRRCLCSDGGISSNFPIHFFDSFLPSRPTFGIALASFDPERHDERIHLPKTPPQSTALPIEDIATLPSFLMAILKTAKDWQDTMQSMLPGYAERIVTVRLDDSTEGGLNLSMSKETITRLTDLGADAGDRMVAEFDMDDQRLSRARALLPTLEGALSEMSGTYDAAYKKVLTQHQVKPRTRGWRKDPFAKFAGSLAAIGAEAKAQHDDPKRKSIRQGDVGQFDGEVRLVATEDRQPKRSGLGMV